MLSHQTLRAEFDALAQEFNQLKESFTAATVAAAVSPGQTPYAPLSSAPAPLDMPHMSNQLTVHTTDSLPRLILTSEQSIRNPVSVMNTYKNLRLFILKQMKKTFLLQQLRISEDKYIELENDIQ